MTIAQQIVMLTNQGLLTQHARSNRAFLPAVFLLDGRCRAAHVLLVLLGEGGVGSFLLGRLAGHFREGCVCECRAVV